jgi:chromosome segregation ATPase
MSSSTGLIIVVTIALIAVVLIGGYLLLGDFSSYDEDQDYVAPSNSFDQELSNLREANFQLSMQLSNAQNEIKNLKSQQNQYSQASTDDRKCSNLDDDYDEIKEDIDDKEEDIEDLEDEIDRKILNNETVTDLQNRLDNLYEDLDDLENDLDDIRDDLNRYDC